MQQRKSICLWRTCLAFTLLFAGTFRPQALAQTSEKLPIPEYFGIYAIDNGKLTSVREGKSDYQSSVREIHVYSMAGGVDKTVSAPEFSSNVRFIIFNPSPAEMAHDLSLYKLGYVRNFLQGNLQQALNPYVFGKENVKISPVNRWLAARLPASQVGLLSKPFGNQPQMIQVVPEVNLSPGVYAFFQAKDKWWQVFVVAFSGTSNASECIDIAFQTAGFGGPMVMGDYFRRYGPPEFPEMTKEHYQPCSGNPSDVPGPPSPGRTDNPAIAPGQPLAPAKANCADYNACLKSGIEAHFASQWQQAIADFEEASKQSPTKADAWGWLGRVYLALGRHQEATTMWDKTLNLGGRLVFQVCLERGGSKPCERGNLSLAPAEVSFTLLDRRNLFAVTPTDVKAMKMGIFNNSARGFINLQVKEEKYHFEFSPDGGNCRIQSIVECPQKELEQQVAVRNYVLQTIPKLASGALGPPPAQPPAATSAGASSSSPGPSPCNQAIDLGYSLLAGGHLYKVKGLGAPGPNQLHLFFDERGNQVSDRDLLGHLATVAWTRENVIVSPDARNRSRLVSQILDTSLAIQKYSQVQDALATAMAEAIKVYATGGASALKVVLDLTLEQLKSQIQTAPKTLLTLTAQKGLRGSLEEYRKMEAKLPPADSTVLDSTNVEEIYHSYVVARTLELPYGALAAKLMPTSGGELAQDAFKTIASGLLSGLPGASVGQKLTLQTLFDVNQNLGSLSDSVPALKNYAENLTLAMKLAEANRRTISAWSAPAATGCEATTAPHK